MTLLLKTGVQAIRVTVMYLTIKYVPYGIFVILGGKLSTLVIKNHVSVHKVSKKRIRAA